MKLKPWLMFVLVGCAAAPVAPVRDACPVPAGVHAVPLSMGQLAPEDGVLLPVPLASHLACAETCCRRTQAELAAQPSSVPWTGIVIGIVVGGAAGAGLGYMAGRAGK